MIMYEEFFEMTHTPFVRNVPVEQLYQSPKLDEALGRLRYAAEKQLFAVLTSDPGCGKSTLIRRFAMTLPKDRYILRGGFTKGFWISWDWKRDSTGEMPKECC